ncbi:MAG: hypothetical protein GXP55_14205 [Deltaproteobacteria bacterium]|nr:hypothetical protein [Deltaproteobacteria bacterium]
MSGDRDKRLSTALVLSASSAMVCVGVLAFLWHTEPAPDPEQPSAPDTVEVRTQTPEDTAESFLDAWRKRDHEIAKQLSVGPAHEAVVGREQGDESLDEETRSIVKVWNDMARDRLEFIPDESANLEDGKLLLAGQAEGEFLGRPYERRIRFVLTHGPEGYRVYDMQLGPRVGAGRDAGPPPGEMPQRGADIP